MTKKNEQEEKVEMTKSELEACLNKAHSEGFTKGGQEKFRVLLNVLFESISSYAKVLQPSDADTGEFIMYLLSCLQQQCSSTYPVNKEEETEEKEQEESKEES